MFSNFSCLFISRTIQYTILYKVVSVLTGQAAGARNVYGGRHPHVAGVEGVSVASAPASAQTSTPARWQRSKAPGSQTWSARTAPTGLAPRR